MLFPENLSIRRDFNKCALTFFVLPEQIDTCLIGGSIYDITPDTTPTPFTGLLNIKANDDVMAVATTVIAKRPIRHS